MTTQPFLIMIKILILVMFSSLAGWTYSEPDKCPHKVTHINNLQFARAFQESISECWISIDNMNSYQTLLYRSYLITSEGMLMVFNSYGQGPDSQFTGAREYYFFPRENFTNEVDFQAKLVSIKLNSKLKLQFQTKVLNLVNQKEFKVKTDSKISRTNKGGVEILYYNGVFLDSGFSLGKSPSSNPEGSSVFKNQLGQVCKVLNKQIFDYKDGENYLQGDQPLKATVSRQCPGFNWSE